MMISFNQEEAVPTFDHPIEMLHACHGKILRQCETLKKLSIHLEENGCDEAAQQAAQGILRYFDTAGMFHHQDEELDLFPALRASLQSDMENLHAMLDRLLAEHIVMMSTWAALRVHLCNLADGTLSLIPMTVQKRFIDSHTSHIALEETELLPLAARLLTVEQLNILGGKMFARRKKP